MKWLLLIVCFFIYKSQSSAQILPAVDHKPVQSSNLEFDRMTTNESFELIQNAGMHQLSTEGDILDSSYIWLMNQDFTAYELIRRYIYTSDDQGNTLTWLETYRDGSQWVNLALTSYTYDGNNNLVNQLTQNYNGSGWDNSFQILYTFNSNNDQLSRLTQDWDGNGWVNDLQQLSTFDDNHHELTQTSTLWNGTDWQNVSLRNHTYDSEGRRIHQLIRSWNGDWINNQQLDYIYDVLGNLDTSYNQIWLTDHWADNYRVIYTYDVSNYILNILIQNALGGDQWQDNNRTVYSYDANHQVIVFLSQTFTNDEWKNDYQFLLTYDEKGNQISAVYQVWDDVLIYQDSTHYYYTLSSGIKDLSHHKVFTISPNPAEEIISISANDLILENVTISIYSQSGVKMMEKNMDFQLINTVDISKLPPGAYHVLVHHDQGIETCKFLKL